MPDDLPKGSANRPVSNIHVDIAIGSDIWDAEPGNITDFCKNVVVRCAQKAQASPFAPYNPNGDIEISLLLTDDEQIRALNRDYRAKDKATNVLSFATLDSEPAPNDGATGMPVILGDIVVSHTTLKKEAGEKNIPFKAHLTHLLCHGVLHLFGFDHQTDTQAELMEATETAFVMETGYKNPYP